MSIYDFIKTSTAIYPFANVAVSNYGRIVMKSDDNCNDCACECDCQSRCDCESDCNCFNTECNCDCDCDCN